MPIYEYICKSCGHEFELMQKMSESSTQACENCGKKKAERVISQTSFMLKGTGWYTTDYAGKKAHGTGNAGSSPCAASGSCPSKSCAQKAS